MSVLASRPARTWLYVPATDARRLKSVLDRGADAIILDLEDGVADAMKPEARAAAGAWLAERPTAGAGGPELWVRLNAGLEGFDDLMELGVPAALTGYVVPKAEDVALLHRMSGWLDVLERQAGRTTPTALAALIESVQGAERAAQVTTVPRVRCLHLGEADLAADLGVRATDTEAFIGYRRHLVHVSRLGGLGGPVGPVSTVIDDEELIGRNARWLRAAGFSGIACVHPRQVAVVNEEFDRHEDSAWARDTLDRLRAAEQAGAGAARDASGQMIDAALARRARQILGLEGPSRPRPGR